MEASYMTDFLEEEFQPMGFFENIYFQMFQNCFNLVTTENVIVILLWFLRVENAVMQKWPVKNYVYTALPTPPAHPTTKSIVDMWRSCWTNLSP